MVLEKYTTTEKISKEDVWLKSLKPEDLLNLPKDLVLEKEKTVLSTDYYALIEALELLINMMRSK